MRLLSILTAVVALVFACSVEAQVTVVKTVGETSTINLNGFKAGDNTASALFLQTLKADLERSGWFTVTSGAAEFSVLGESSLSGGNVSVKCEVYNSATRKREIGKSYSISRGKARALAHRVADEIVLAVAGKPGIASTRIVLVGNRTGKKELYICDADGQNLRQITNDKSVSLGPKWGPEARRIVYTSYRMQFPDVYMIDLTSGQRSCIANYAGLNTCPALSPDNKSVALVLSKFGNPDLFIKDLGSGRLTRLTSTGEAAEASPSWAPDGRKIVYVSDMRGSPQLYVIDKSGKDPVRISSTGRENVDPDWGKNNFIVCATKTGANYQICVINPDTMKTEQLTDEPYDHEDPSWAPDGRHIVYTRTRNYTSELFIIDTMSRRSVCLLRGTANWFSPDWSPK